MLDKSITTEKVIFINGAVTTTTTSTSSPSTTTTTTALDPFVWTKSNSPSESWRNIKSSSTGDKLIACYWNSSIIQPIHGGLYRSVDYGVSWIKIDDSHNWNYVSSSSDGSKLAAVELTSGSYIWTSKDYGVTWSRKIAATGGSWWGPITASSDGSKLVVAKTYYGVNGKYRTDIYSSSNSGDTWGQVYSFTDLLGSCWGIASSSDCLKLVSCFYQDKIYVSTNFGTSWTATGSNGYWHSVCSSVDGTVLAAAASGQNYASVNSGVSWFPVGMPSGWSDIACSSNGSFMVAANMGGDRRIVVSRDYGVTWISTGTSAAWSCVTCSSDGSRVCAGGNNSNIYSGISIS